MCEFELLLMPTYLNSIYGFQLFFYLRETEPQDVASGVIVKPHNDDKEYRCISCGLYYVHHSTLWRHKQKIHNASSIRTPRSKIDESNKLNNPCEICKKKFRNWNSLRKHMSAIHSGNRQPTTCELCGKILSSRSIAMIHQRRLHLPKPYACQLCGKTYALRYELNRHMQKPH